MNIEFNKKNNSMIAVWAIVAFIYILAFAFVPFPKNGASVWIEFIFTLISIGAGLFTTLKAFGEDGAVVSRFYGYPIFRVGAFYAVAQIVLGIIVFAISAFVKVPYWISFLVSIIFLGVAAIGFIAVDNAKDIVENSDADLKTVTKTVEMFSVDIAGAVDMCTDAELKKAVEKLAEDLRYSDPVSSEATYEIETEIKTMIENLKSFTASGDTKAAQDIILKLTNSIKERNRICKLSKNK